MSLNRRTLIAGLSAAVLAPHAVRAATVTDGAGRPVPVPERVERVFPAGAVAGTRYPAQMMALLDTGKS